MHITYPQLSGLALGRLHGDITTLGHGLHGHNWGLVCPNRGDARS